MFSTPLRNFNMIELFKMIYYLFKDTCKHLQNALFIIKGDGGGGATEICPPQLYFGENLKNESDSPRGMH